MIPYGSLFCNNRRNVTVFFAEFAPFFLVGNYLKTSPDLVKRMVEEGHDCSEVLVQLAAVRSAIDNTGKVILKDHIHHCMVDAVAAGDQTAIDDLCQAIDKFMK